MRTNATPREAIGLRFLVDEPRNDLRSTAEIARAEQKIAEWLEYLPEDCVAAMIARGWHFSVQ
jgi:hypothetical protein